MGMEMGLTMGRHEDGNRNEGEDDNEREDEYKDGA